jgi:glycosyltransferase involved in cell wall biosynthesis
VAGKPRLAVVSPFLDTQHGTERCVVEQVERLAWDYEVHVYSNQVEDIDPASIVWHRVPVLSGPHLLAYCWWFLANHLWRWWDQRVRGLRFDLIYTPGINCVDADVIAVHIVFSEFYSQVKEELTLGLNPVSSWPRLVHRRVYYLLIIFLEHFVYGHKEVLLTAVSKKTAGDLRQYGKRGVRAIYHGVNLQRFNCQIRGRLRVQARRLLGIPESALCLLLVGNDWRKKGLSRLLDAIGRVPSGLVRLLVVGNDDPAPHKHLVDRMGIGAYVDFLPLRSDVEAYYAAADIYVSPALEDAFGLPPLEAMACGIPVIVSSRAGVSEIVTDGVDGLILKDPEDVVALTQMIVTLANEPLWRKTLGENAARTACQYTWERNAAELKMIFEQVMQRRSGHQTSAMQEVL